MSRCTDNEKFITRGTFAFASNPNTFAGNNTPVALFKPAIVPKNNVGRSTSGG